MKWRSMLDPVSSFICHSGIGGHNITCEYVEEIVFRGKRSQHRVSGRDVLADPAFLIRCHSRNITRSSTE